MDYGANEKSARGSRLPGTPGGLPVLCGTQRRSKFYWTEARYNGNSTHKKYRGIIRVGGTVGNSD